MTNANISYNQWCMSPVFDEETKKELLAIQGDEREIEERFYRDLEFGTGGLRGILGAGTNRMNIYTVRKATQGLANYIIKKGGQDKGVAVAYDSRRMSQEFALATSLCLVANGIKTYLFDCLHSTPELSFAVRQLSCIAGVVITASHNPPQYNGYKVYWEDGAQITAPLDREIIGEVNRIEGYEQLKSVSRDEAEKSGLLTMIGSEIDREYIEEIKKLILSPSSIQNMADQIKIVYTPIHGTGNRPVQRVLAEIGFANTYVVEEQELPDGEFPTVAYPNPEDPAVFELGLKLAKEVGADMILATDPDADRLGVYVKDGEGEYQALTGNMSGILMCEYILEKQQQQDLLKEDSTIIKTIVTTNMADALAEAYGIKCIETLTGFKYIGEQIKLFEEIGEGTYEFGFEESYGCLAGTYARDKDAISAVMVLCDAAAYYAEQGMSLWGKLQELYEKYGYYQEGLLTQTLEGKDGVAQIQALVEGYRRDVPQKLAGLKVIAFRDYASGERHVLGEGKVEKMQLPKSNVLYYELEDDAWFCVRPSGTEPKIKYYYGAKGGSMETVRKICRDMEKSVSN